MDCETFEKEVGEAKFFAKVAAICGLWQITFEFNKGFIGAVTLLCFIVLLVSLVKLYLPLSNVLVYKTKGSYKNITKVVLPIVPVLAILFFFYGEALSTDPSSNFGMNFSPFGSSFNLMFPGIAALLGWYVGSECNLKYPSNAFTVGAVVIFVVSMFYAGSMEDKLEARSLQAAFFVFNTAAYYLALLINYRKTYDERLALSREIARAREQRSQ